MSAHAFDDRPSQSAFTFGELAFSLLVFALLMTLALVGAYALPFADLPQLHLQRAVGTIWATVLLTLPAYYLYARGRGDGSGYRVWRLFWTFALIAYLIHIAYGLFFIQRLYTGTGEGLFSALYADQGSFIATVNLVLGAWWLLDVGMAWTLRERWYRWLAIERFLLHVAFLVIFAVSAYFFGRTLPFVFVGLAVILALRAAGLDAPVWPAAAPVTPGSTLAA